MGLSEEMESNGVLNIVFTFKVKKNRTIAHIADRKLQINWLATFGQSFFFILFKNFHMDFFLLLLYFDKSNEYSFVLFETYSL